MTPTQHRVNLPVRLIHWRITLGRQLFDQDCVHVGDVGAVCPVGLPLQVLSVILVRSRPGAPVPLALNMKSFQPWGSYRLWYLVLLPF